MKQYPIMSSEVLQWVLDNHLLDPNERRPGFAQLNPEKWKIGKQGLPEVLPISELYEYIDVNNMHHDIDTKEYRFWLEYPNLEERQIPWDEA